MERDIQLIRKVLEQVRDRADGTDYITIYSIAGYESSAVAYHVHLCNLAGYLDVIDASLAPARSTVFPEYRVRGLTWDGHDKLTALQPSRAASKNWGGT